MLTSEVQWAHSGQWVHGGGLSASSNEFNIHGTQIQRNGAPVKCVRAVVAASIGQVKWSRWALETEFELWRNGKELKFLQERVTWDFLPTWIGRVSCDVV